MTVASRTVLKYTFREIEQILMSLNFYSNMSHFLTFAQSEQSLPSRDLATRA